MGRLEVQGIVSAKTNEPLVQFRQLDDAGRLESGWQVSVAEARQIAQQVGEAATNAIYDAALVGWATATWPNDPSIARRVLALVRDYRQDEWGTQAYPADWRQPGLGEYGQGASTTEGSDGQG